MSDPMADICSPVKFVHVNMYVLSKRPRHTMIPMIADFVEPATAKVRASFFSMVHDIAQFMTNPSVIEHAKATRNAPLSHAEKDEKSKRFQRARALPLKGHLKI